jgi:hypothetical protein
MGITHSSEEGLSEYDPEQGYVPKKLREIDTHYHESDYVFIVGDGKVLRFDTRSWKLEQIEVSFNSFDNV